VRSFRVGTTLATAENKFLLNKNSGGQLKTPILSLRKTVKMQVILRVCNKLLVIMLIIIIIIIIISTTIFIVLSS